ncbi:hypothetical protein KKF34_00145 [Myxococcota bacterium]|nr:hypothetical protein [Myxococcota bacterium]MBU1379552.1 hypothetical protein [Myxococcota bacterium]MBU1495270.1 hypothetical protein [Myxococcota bacterium]
MKPKISLSPTLRGDEVLFSPFRIFLFLLAGGMGLYLLFSRTTGPAVETKVFHGTQDIKSIQWKMNNASWGVFKTGEHWKIKGWMNDSIFADGATVNDFIIKLDSLHGIPVKKDLSNPNMTLTIETQKAKTDIDIFYKNRKLYLRAGKKIYSASGMDVNWLRLLPEKMANYKVFGAIKDLKDINEITLNSMTSGGNRVYTIFRSRDGFWQIGHKKPWTASLDETGKLIQELGNITFTEFTVPSGDKGNIIISLKAVSGKETALYYLKSNKCPAGEKNTVLISGKNSISGCIREKLINLISVPLPSLMEKSVLAAPAANAWTSISFLVNGKEFKLNFEEKIWNVLSENRRYPGDFITIEEWISSLKKTVVLSKVDNLPCTPQESVIFTGSLITWRLNFCTHENNVYLKRNSDFYGVVLATSTLSLFSRNWFDFVSRDLLEDEKPVEIKRIFPGNTEHFRLQENGRITVLSPLDLPFSDKELSDYTGRLRNFRGLKYLPTKPSDISKPEIKTEIIYKDNRKVSLQLFNKGQYIFINSKYFQVNPIDSEWITKPWTKDSVKTWKITSASQYSIRKSDGKVRSYINSGSHFTLIDKNKKIIPSAVMIKYLGNIENYFNNIKAERYGRLEKFDIEVRIKSSSGLPLHIRMKFEENYINIEHTARKVIYLGRPINKPFSFFLIDDQ